MKPVVFILYIIDRSAQVRIETHSSLHFRTGEYLVQSLLVMLIVFSRFIPLYPLALFILNVLNHNRFGIGSCFATKIVEVVEE